VPVVVRIGPGVDPGWIVAAVGVGLDVVGWYQISGQPTEAQQLPYLASATIPGAALIVAGAVLIAARRRDPVGARRLSPGATDVHGRRDGLWALPDGSYLHRPDCPLLDGKPEAFEVSADGTAQDGAVPDETAPDQTAPDQTAPNQKVPDRTVPSRPCPICEPDLVTAP
jgi:hypothetical protein